MGKVDRVIELGLVKAWIFHLGLMVVLSSAMADEDNSSRRLENAQKGIAEASWPRKPDNRLSPLSGKMKDMKEISPRFFGDEKEVRAKSAAGWQKEASLDQKAEWDGAAGTNWERTEWNRAQGWAGSGNQNEKFQPTRQASMEQTVEFREVQQNSATDWSSRSARLGAGQSASLRMYEGKLTRVRQQVWREEESPRELGPGRQEKFSPEEVERMLSQPVGELRGSSTGLFPAAVPLAVAGN